MASPTHTNTNDKLDNDNHLIQHVTDHWNKLNKTLEHLPKFQNHHQTGVSDEHIQELESKLNVTLPREIRAMIKIHDGRKHIGYGLSYRLATTDLLPLSEWKPYEKDNDDFGQELCNCLSDKNDGCADKHLHEDVREHLKVYMKGMGKISKENNDDKLSDKKEFESLPCELLIIGQGMDDYAEQYLLSILSGRIYLAIHNIPEWQLIGTFADWIEKGVTNVNNQKSDLQEQHDETVVN